MVKNQNMLEIRIDSKDKKIIGALFDNGRATFSEIAKKARVSKEVANYRLRQLVKSGLITEFNTIIDVRKLGWQIFLVYVGLRSIDIEKEREIIEEIKTHKNVAWLVKCIGNYDLIIKFFVKKNEDVGKIMKSMEDKFKDNLDDYTINFLLEESAVPQSFIYAGQPTKETYFSKFEEGAIKLDELDFKILKLLEHNSRMQISEISSLLNQQRDTIKYHLKKLEKSKIILKYRPSLWPHKIGYNWYLVVLKLGNLDRKTDNNLISYIVNHPNVTYYYKTSGSSDLEIEFKIKTNQELNNVLMDLRGILKNSLKRHEILVILEEFKYTYFPDCMVEHIKK